MIESLNYKRIFFCHFYPQFNFDNAYRTFISDDNLVFQAIVSRSNFIVDGHIHRFLSSSIFVRVNAKGFPSKSELFFLWCMKTQKSINLGFLLGIKFGSVLATRRTRLLILGSFITMIVVNLNVLSPFKLTIGRHMDELNIDSLSKMHLIEKFGKESVHFLSANELRLKEEVVSIGSEGLLQSLTSEVKDLKRKINKMMQTQKAICDHYNIQLEFTSVS